MAAAGVTAAAVWVDVLPSMRNFGSRLTEELGPEGERAGDRMGRETERGLGGRVAALAAVGATIGVAVGAAVVEALNVSEARAKMAVQLGLTAQDGQRYGQLAGELYSGAYGENLDQVNEALVAVTRNIGDSVTASDDDLKHVSGTVLNLASTFGVDLGGATAAVGQMLKTGLAPDAQSALDIITVGLQSGVDKAGDFLDTLNEYGTQFRKLGLSGEVATGLLSQGLQAGARDADLVADALKEFSIRAVDGSTAAAAGYEALGLSAQDLTAQIAQGGEPAAAGLQLVLDRLRAMDDPVAQNAAAVALFGTQAEDLGAALFALDPGTAVDTLGQVGGAAEAMNTQLGETAGARIESFKRTLTTGLVDFIGGQVLPALDSVTAAGSTLFGPAWDGVRSFLGFLAGAGGIAVFAVLGIAGAMHLWSFAQIALNSAMFASPITWWVVGILALAAAVVWAYNNLDWFRGLVQGVWQFLQGAAAWLTSVFVGAWNFCAAAFAVVGAAASWLWSSVLAPVFGFIGRAATITAAIVATLFVAPFVIAWNVLAAVATWAWSTILEPTFTALGAIAMWVWSSVLSPVFGWIGAAWSVLVGGIQWYWASVLSPVFSAVGMVASWLWTSVLAPTFSAIGGAWSGLMNGLSTAWNSVVRPLFEVVIMGAVRAVADAFGWTVDRIAEVWGRIQGIVRPPVQFVVDVVYNAGIRPAWNFIAGIFDLGQLPELRFARGGLVPGYAPGRDVVPALLSPGEAVLVPEAVRAIGADTILALNASARAGRPTGGVSPAGDPPFDAVQRFADGGIVGWLWDTVGAVGSFVGGVADFVSDPVGATRRAFEGIDLGGLRGVGQLSEALLRMPGKAVDGAIDFLRGLIDDQVGDAGAGPAQALAFARGEAGKPYLWGGAGPGGYDCSGFMAAIYNVIMGRSPYGRLGTTATMPWAGFRRGESPVFTIGNSRNTGLGIGHMAGTLLGTNVESRGGRGVVVGPGARGARDSLFPERWSPAFDSGGMLPTGWSTVFNGTGRPEPVLTDQQWTAISTAARGGDGPEEFVLVGGQLEILDDGLVRVVDGRLQRAGTRIRTGRRA